MTKDQLRQQLRDARRAHVAALPDNLRTLMLMRPPGPVLELVPANATIGLYHATPSEAPTLAYAKFFLEHGHTLALPRFAAADSEMSFAAFTDPFGESDLEPGPFDLQQPSPEAEALVPDVVFVPLIGFTAQGARLGQGGGHYDRWLGAHPHTVAIGLGWDCQLVDDLPVEAHDVPLRAVVTPTRMYGPFA